MQLLVLIGHRFYRPCPALMALPCKRLALSENGIPSYLTAIPKMCGATGKRAESNRKQSISTDANPPLSNRE